jgi:hypothetical protein
LPFEEADLARFQALGPTVLQDIRMNCQPALLAELKRCGEYAEIKFTESCWPWPRIIAGHPQGQQIVGSGILRFAVAVDENKICPYQELALVHFVATRVDGTVSTFFSSSRTDDDFQSNITRNDRLLAFRLAAGFGQFYDLASWVRLGEVYLELGRCF